MEEPKLSIITPSYNQSQFLEKNIMSVKHQSNEQVEHIVVDGGSTDNTKDILVDHQDEYNLKWISENDKGQSNALNKGLRLAQGEWIGWQNSDDFYLPGAFSSFFQAEKSITTEKLIFGDLLVVNETGREIGRKYSIPPSKFAQRYWSLFTSNQSAFFHKSLFEQIGGFDESLDYTMDADIFWRIIENEISYYIVPEFIGAIRKHENAKTVGDTNVRLKQEQELTEIYGTTWYENIFPNNLLRIASKVLKVAYLIRYGRLDAISWNLSTKIR